MLRGKNRELSCLNEGKKGGALHHLSVIVELAQSAPYNPPFAHRSVIPLERARAMPSHGIASLG